MTSRPIFTVEIADWVRDAHLLRAIREAVFVIEQGVPMDLEWDGIDSDCTHVIAYTNDRAAIGTARLQKNGHIGRMAVLAGWRKQGVGSLLLQELIAVAQSRDLKSIELNAQTHALTFYQRFGFVAEGAEFHDAGIAHRHMRLAPHQAGLTTTPGSSTD